MANEFHEDWARPDEVTGSSDRGFGLTIGTVCLLIGAIRLALEHAYALWWLGAGIVLIGLAMVWTWPLAPLNALWLRLGVMLHRVVNPIVMALLFITTIVPIGLLMRLCGKDSLRLRPDQTAETYWLPHDHRGPESETMAQQF